MQDHLVVLINNSQHGFIPGKSCTSQLVEVHDYIGSLLDAGKQTDVIYMYMSNAFDDVNHQILTLASLVVYSVGSPPTC
jgi:hypothetical protein